MPITRTPMIDDDGSGTTGTVVNNPWKQELYDQIDALATAGALPPAGPARNLLTSTGAAWQSKAPELPLPGNPGDVVISLAGAWASGGHWFDVPFSAANFSATDGATWTVAQSAISANRYMIVGRLMIWRMYLAWFQGGNVITGTPNILRISIPGGRTAAYSQIITCNYAIDGSRVHCDASPAGGLCDFTKAFPGVPWTGAPPGLIFVIAFEII